MGVERPDFEHENDCPCFGDVVEHSIDCKNCTCDKSCKRPPEGWMCSREYGHEGPCAARPRKLYEMAAQYALIEYNEAWQCATDLKDEDEPAFKAGWDAAQERIADLAAEVERLTDALNLANNERLALRTKTSQIDSLRGQIQQESRRLDFLIYWLGFHDDLEGSGIRDWEDNDDARKAIDEALGTDQQLQPKGEPR